MRSAGGFTIVEMVIVLVIAGVLAALAMPNLSEFFLDNARTSRINLLVTAFNVARSEAVKLNAAVSVCPSSAALNFAKCTGDGKGRFDDGWIVFRDVDGAGDFDVGTDTVIQSWDPGMDDDNNTDTPPNMRALTKVGGAPVDSFTYLGSGFPASGTIAANTHVVYCDKRGQRSARAIEILTTGQPRLAVDTNNDGIPDVGGTDLTCP